tara:strand:- start:12936 stop:13910 length:975 start_codon:yes stop_codon:yes gene_type:complete
MNKVKTYNNRFIVQKELRKLINIINERILYNNGILFGDIVTNLLITKYYKNEFEKKNFSYKLFWNTKVDIETILRTDTINRIDVYFVNMNDYINFVEFLKVSKIFEIISLQIIDNPLYINNLYEISTKLGKTLTYSGYSINLDINILMKLPLCKYLEPPFNNANFLSDILIMSKNREFKISKNTGIVDIDKMNIIEKSILHTFVLKQLCDKKNYILSTNINLNNEIARKVLEYNKNGFSIINSPLIIDKCNNYFRNKCYICQYEINYNDDIMILDNKTKCTLHHKCCNKYLEQLLEKNEKINCPLRENINFIKNDIETIKKLIF